MNKPRMSPKLILSLKADEAKKMHRMLLEFESSLSRLEAWGGSQEACSAILAGLSEVYRGTQMLELESGEVLNDAV